jgi:hypothetical protein
VSPFSRRFPLSILCMAPPNCSAALHCNHRWALDGCDPASYAGVLWCFGEPCGCRQLRRRVGSGQLKLSQLLGCAVNERSSALRSKLPRRQPFMLLVWQAVPPPPLVPRHVRRPQGFSCHPHQRQPGAALHGGPRAAPAPRRLLAAAALRQAWPGCWSIQPQACL